MVLYLYGRRGRTLTDEQIVSRYLGGASSLDVALEAGCTAETVRDLVLKAGHKMRKRGGQRPKKPRPISDEDIVSRYVAGESGVKLADLCACSTAMIYNVLARAGVRRRRCWEGARGRRGRQQADS